MKIKRKIIEIDRELCNGCGECITACAEGALAIIDGKAKIISDVYCDGLGHCLGHCPQGALKVVEKEAEEFDQEKVDRILVEQEKKESGESQCGCQVQTILPSFSTIKKETKAQNAEAGVSALSNWPVQLGLVPPDAPFLDKCDLLIAADCVPFAYPGFHRDILKGRVLLSGCPKLDNPEEYVEKLAAIFSRADIKTIEIAVMEVPCCSGMKGIVAKALGKAGKSLQFDDTVIGVRGEIAGRKIDDRATIYDAARMGRYAIYLQQHQHN